MPRHQIRNPSLLDPWRARGSIASPSAPLAPPFSASLFFSFPVTVAPDSLSSSSFLPHSPALLLFSQRFSRSLCISVSRERSHAKSLKGDEQTTSRVALGSRSRSTLVQIFSLRPVRLRIFRRLLLFGNRKRGREKGRQTMPMKISFLEPSVVIWQKSRCCGKCSSSEDVTIGKFLVDRSYEIRFDLSNVRLPMVGNRKRRGTSLRRSFGKFKLLNAKHR